MWDRFFDFFVESAKIFFMPMVCSYHLITEDLFFNTAIENAPPLEKAANTLLVPFQYLCAGKVAYETENGSWQSAQRFDYTNQYWLKTAASVIALPISLIAGSSLKAMSFYHESTRRNFASLSSARASHNVPGERAKYKHAGIDRENYFSYEWSESQGHKRRPGDENHLGTMKQALVEIAAVLNQAHIPWWVDCGTCLGAYRYGGVIPWDNDIDIAILIDDFENARQALNGIDRTRYLVQDWSSRDTPCSYFKIYIRETGHLIDVYCYEIDRDTQELRYIFSLDSNVFFPKWWKERERRYTVPTPISSVFPLKRAHFDGIEVFVPHHIVQFLQRYYGENLAPVRLYDEKTGRYEKDLSHPYWQQPYVH